MIARGLLLALSLLLSTEAQAQRWVTSWATAPMAMEGDNALPVGDGPATIDQVVRLSTGGDRLRLRITNRHSDTPLAIAGVTIARAPSAGSARTTGTERRVSFGNSDAIVVPAGADYWSDPVALTVPADGHLRIRIVHAQPPQNTTGHPGARTTSHVRYGAGKAVQVPRWFHLSAVDVAVGETGSTIALLGDSITDGYGVVENSDGRWSDYLRARLAGDPRTRHLAVANLGIGGNRLLADGLGPNASARLDRDVLGLARVSHLVVLIGVNDLGTLTRDAPVAEAAHRSLVERMIAAYRQIAAKARGHGIRVIGATILPYGGSQYYHPDTLNEADRQAVNAFIRSPGAFDAVIDFDRAMRDPARTDHLRAEVDSGDGLHPSDAGYRAMAKVVPLKVFTRDSREAVVESGR